MAAWTDLIISVGSMIVSLRLVIFCFSVFSLTLVSRFLSSFYYTTSWVRLRITSWAGGGTAWLGGGGLNELIKHAKGVAGFKVEAC
jgi:hypothetical protein